MSHTLKRNAAFLKLHHNANAKTRKAMLKSNCTDDFIRSISECCKNVLKGHVRLTKAQFEPLRRRRQTLRTLSRKKTSPDNAIQYNTFNVWYRWKIPVL